MKDVALAVAVIVVVAALALGFQLYRVVTRPARSGATWRIVERSQDGVTHVQFHRVVLRADGSTTVEDVREVGSVADLDPNYDDELLTLRARAQQRLAVVAEGP